MGWRGTKCYKCHGRFASYCSTRNLLLEEELDEDDHEYVEEVCIPENGASDAEEAIRV